MMKSSFLLHKKCQQESHRIKVGKSFFPVEKGDSHNKNEQEEGMFCVWLTFFWLNNL